MVKSMTGFGKAEATVRNKKITVELRSLNSKQLDLNLRLPAVYRQAEYEIRNLLTRSLLRGKAASASGETRMHYQYLLHNLDKALNK